ncbi:Gfo/Idh/MocA family protein [Paenibacillus mesophilus]|uniref:Gfo/Idh/MocA family protein n=1 Tax=Paenibacillus mesophilus TaxID=2582849 RepID=UPI00130507B5|nr:Gfo/Idh/MocA family oxidoreductase [Paenibacillus mesophilus]
MKTYRAAIVGAGIIAKLHVRALRESERTVFTAIADIDPERARVLAEPSGAAVYEDYRLMIAQEKPDIAIVTLPHHLHKEATIFCMEQGCHVLLEKPMALNAAECAEINEVAAKYGVKALVGHMQHFFAANIKAKEIIESGRLGQLVAINDRRHHPYFLPDRPGWFLDKARSGGGVVINLGSHSIDKIQWLTGTTIRSVKASMTYYGERGDVEGSASLFMQTSSGVPAMVSLCGYNNVAVNETELLFTGGQLKITGSQGLWIGTFDQPYEPVSTEGFAEPFAAQWNSMLDCVEHGMEEGISGIYGQSVCAVVDAAYRSSETGKEQEVESFSTTEEVSVR